MKQYNNGQRKGMMYGGEAKKRKVKNYKGGGCVMAGRGGNFKGVK